MNIWLDVTTLFQPLHATDVNGCRNDCPSDKVDTFRNDCSLDICRSDCPSDGINNFRDQGGTAVNTRLIDSCTNTSTMLMLLKQEVAQYRHSLIQAPTLHIQQYEKGLWLVCHPLGSGKLAVLDDEAFELLRQFERATQLELVLARYNSAAPKAEEIVALLLRLGFLVDLDQPAAAQEETGQDHMLAAWLHVTNACNLGCHYCYVSKTNEHMSADTSRRAVDAVIRSALKNGYQSIHITYAGGEASLQLPQVIAMHDYALLQAQEHRLRLFAGMISNGVAMPVRFIEQLKQRKIGLAISLDGVGEDHDQQRPLVNGAGSFAFVDRTITRLLAHGLVPNINVTVSQRNLANLPRLLEYILARDLPFGLSYYRDNDCASQHHGLQFSEAAMISGMRDAFAYIEAHLPNRPLLGSLVDKTRLYGSRQYGCGVGRHYMAINQRGGIASCQVDIANSVTSIYADNPLQVIRDNRRGVQGVSVDEKEGCKHCQWRYWCTGGCAMLTYRLTGRSDIKSPNCAIYKALFPEALRLEAARLLKYTAPFTF